MIKGFQRNFPKRKNWGDDENYFKEKKFKREKIEKKHGGKNFASRIKKIENKRFSGKLFKKNLERNEKYFKEKKIYLEEKN